MQIFVKTFTIALKVESSDTINNALSLPANHLEDGLLVLHLANGVQILVKTITGMIITLEVERLTRYHV